MSVVLPSWAELRSDTRAPELVLGTMNFGRRTPEPEAERIIERAIERGVRLLDTANVYNDGESERIVGRALARHRSRSPALAVATKVGLMRPAGRVEGLSRARVIAAADESLARLEVEAIDLYYLHAPDHQTPLEETLDAIAELFLAKKIRAFGVSNFASWQILEIMQGADARGMPRPIVSQVMYNLLVRQLELEYLRFARTHRIHSTVYNPLAGGVLTGRHAPGAAVSGARFEKNPIYQKRYWSDPLLALATELEALAIKAGLTPTALAYAWLCTRPGVDSILIGPGTVAHLDQAFEAIEQRARLDRPLFEAIDQAHRGYLGTDASYAR